MGKRGKKKRTSFESLARTLSYRCALCTGVFKKGGFEEEEFEREIRRYAYSNIREDYKRIFVNRKTV